MMDLDRFNAILEAYGADPARWPDAERAEAEALLRANPAAKTAFDRAAELDALIAPAAIAPAPSEMLTARLLRAVPQPEFLGDWKHVAAAAALALVERCRASVGIEWPAPRLVTKTSISKPPPSAGRTSTSSAEAFSSIAKLWPPRHV